MRARARLALPIVLAAAATATMVVGAHGSSAGSGSGSGAEGRLPARPSGEMPVVVVDERGAPVAGVEVTGSYPENPGPIASTCCVDVSLGRAITDKDGVAVLLQPPFTFRPATITARRAGWPEVSLSLGLGSRALRDASGRLVIVLGPPRDVAGRIEMGDGCPPGFVEVRGYPPEVTAPVDADGRFVLRGLAAGKVAIGFSACGRGSRGGDIVPRPGEPVVLKLEGPPASRQPRPYDLPSSSRPQAPSSSSPPAPPRPPPPGPPSAKRRPPAPERETAPAPWPPPRPVPACAPPGPELVVAGDFDTVATDPRCRFILAGRRTTANRYIATTWTLVRADGSTLALGLTGGDVPVLGERIALVSPPAEEITLEILDLATAKREQVRPLKRFALGAGDAVVLASAPGARVMYDSVALDVRWRDGQRRRLAANVATGWTLVGDGRWLVYGKLSDRGSQEEIHVMDLIGRQDQLIATAARGAWPLDGEPGALVIDGEQRVLAYDPATGAREVLAEPGRGWRAFGRDLLVRHDADSTVVLRTPAGARPLPFRWPRSLLTVGERRITTRHLLFGHGGDAVLIDTATGAPRILAEGIRLADYAAPPIAGDWVALGESSGRTLIASLSGRPARAVGRGAPRSFSPDGRWLIVEQEMAYRYDVVAVEDPARRLSLSGWGGGWLPDAPVFVYTGLGAFNVPRPLHAALPAEGRTALIEAQVLAFRALAGGEVLVVVPAGGARRPGIWRRHVPAAERGADEGSRPRE